MKFSDQLGPKLIKGHHNLGQHGLDFFFPINKVELFDECYFYFLEFTHFKLDNFFMYLYRYQDRITCQIFGIWIRIMRIGIKLKLNRNIMNLNKNL